MAHAYQSLHYSLTAMQSVRVMHTPPASYVSSLICLDTESAIPISAIRIKSEVPP